MRIHIYELRGGVQVKEIVNVWSNNDILPVLFNCSRYIWRFCKWGSDTDERFYPVSFTSYVYRMLRQSWLKEHELEEKEIPVEGAIEEAVASKVMTYLKYGRKSKRETILEGLKVI